MRIHGELEVLHEDWADNWKPENAKRIVNAAITRYGAGFDAVLAANDGTAGGAGQALLEEGVSGKVLVTGGLHPYGSYEGELRVAGAEARFVSVADAERAAGSKLIPKPTRALARTSLARMPGGKARAYP